MKIFNRIGLTLLTLLTCIGASAKIAGSWKLHPTFDNSVEKVIDTPSRCYFMGFNQNLNDIIVFKTAPDMTLFYYDKEGDEIVAAAQRHDLASTAVRLAEYNGKKGYLMIIYDTFDIDLLYDSGEVRNIGALKNANITGSKNVNFISFDPDHDRAWLATDFGYIAINDKKCEVAESRNYGIPFTTMMRFGDDLYLATETATYRAPVAEPRLNISDYSRPLAIQGALGLYPITAEKFYKFYAVDRNYNAIVEINYDGKDYTKVEEIKPYGKSYISLTNNGITFFSSTLAIFAVSDERYRVYFTRPAEEQNVFTSSCWNRKDFFSVVPRKGVRSFTTDAQKNFSLTRDFRLPNAPNAYYSRAMVYHPRYGMLVNSHGLDFPFFDNNVYEEILLSGLKGGEWTPLSPAYRYPEQAGVGNDPLGLAVDPAADKFIYCGSPFSGITRLNLDDPKDIIHYTRPGDPYASLPGYVKIVDDNPEWARLNYFSHPRFDSGGVLWTYHCNYKDASGIELMYLDAEARRATTSASNARPWKSFTIKGVPSQFPVNFLPLTASANKNYLVYMTADGLLIYNHAGTLDNKSDDSFRYLTSFTDQDGGVVTLTEVSMTYEDPASGMLWIGTASGIFYCQPKNLLQGQAIMNRVKIARNDGTSLADYLLNGVRPNAMIADASGRKWIGTQGAGIVVTSSDCKTIIDEFTAANSDLPSDVIYCLAYNPENSSIMVSTDKGICEFFMGGDPDNAPEADAVKAYPNPVTPDYYGWVNIEGSPTTRS